MVKKKGEKFCKVCKKVITGKAVEHRSKKHGKPSMKTKKNVCEFC